MRQLKLFKEDVSREHGGSLNQGKRKGKRPLDFSKPVHLILKASDNEILLNQREVVLRTINEMCDRFLVKTYAVGVNADHVHLNLKFADRSTYNSWIRATTGLLTRRLWGLHWRFLPYTRIETWGRDFKRVQDYVRKNEIEGQFIGEVMRRVEEFRQGFVSELVAV